jgi:hypothetical protein
LRDLLQGAHHASDGDYLEHLVREEVRRHLPDRYRVSTGFLSNVEPGADTHQRRVSSQFDVLVWDAHDYPALFEVGEFAVIPPAACIAVLEVTATLDKAKVATDLAKLDDVFAFHLRRTKSQMPPYPYTALVAFEGETTLETTLGHLEAFFHHGSTHLPLQRYHALQLRKSWLETGRSPYFLDAVCVLDRGFIRGRHDRDTGTSCVRYDAYPHIPDDPADPDQTDVDDAFGLLQRELTRWFARRRRPRGFFREPDIPREFSFTPLRPPDKQVWIEDWTAHFPGRNVFETTSSNPPASFDKYASVFAPVDHRDDNPMMYVDELPGVSRTLERLDDTTWAVGAWKNGERTGRWRLVRELDEGGYVVAPIWVRDGTLYDAPKDDAPEVLGSHDDFREIVPTVLDDA